MTNKKPTEFEEIQFFCEILKDFNVLQLTKCEEKDLDILEPTEHKEIKFFCKILEKLNFFSNPDIIEKKIKEIGLIYSKEMNGLYDAKTNDMLGFDIWDGNNFSEDAKFVIATYILDDFKQNILTNDKQI